MELLMLMPLSLMILSDFFHRKILLVHLIIFGGLQLAFNLQQEGLITTGLHFFVNSIILLLIGCVSILYTKFRFGKKEVLGAGDIFFVFILSPYFDCQHFLYFLIASSLFSLISWILYFHIWHPSKNEIPLVSGIGLCYCIVLIYSKIVIP